MNRKLAIGAAVFLGLVGLTMVGGTDFFSALVLWLFLTGSVAVLWFILKFVFGVSINGLKTTRVKYVSGLPAGKAGGSIDVSVAEGSLRFYRAAPWPMKGFEYFLPINTIAGLDVRSQQNVSLGRAFFVGFFALLWRRTDRFLVISQDLNGLRNEVLLLGTERNLEQIRQQILQARTV